jgi:hypothetical protein
VDLGFCGVERVSKEDESLAIDLVRSHEDKTHSICDAMSFVVMARLGITSNRQFESSGSEEGSRRRTSDVGVIRRGLRVVASRYYAGRRPPITGLFESTDNKLGDQSLLFRVVPLTQPKPLLDLGRWWPTYCVYETHESCA